MLPLAIFAVIVVFAAEIRHALGRLGRSLSMSRLGGRRVETYDDIVLAATLFAKNKTGALIIIERQDGLGSSIDSGVALDANLSYDLLATIFQQKGPLHDGAVIVQRDRIAAAACFLPLATDPQLSSELGTRHRAGIGITQETDAIAVIVSEETGRISIAFRRRDRARRHAREAAGANQRVVAAIYSERDVADRGNRPRSGKFDGPQRRSAGRTRGERSGALGMREFFRNYVLAQPGAEGPGAGHLGGTVVGGVARSDGGIGCDRSHRVSSCA